MSQRDFNIHTSVLHAMVELYLRGWTVLLIGQKEVMGLGPRLLGAKLLLLSLSVLCFVIWGSYWEKIVLQQKEISENYSNYPITFLLQL